MYASTWQDIWDEYDGLTGSGGPMPERGEDELWELHSAYTSAFGYNPGSGVAYTTEHFWSVVFESGWAAERCTTNDAIEWGRGFEPDVWK